MRRNQSENDFRGRGGGGGGVRRKSRSSDDVYTRSQLEASAAGKESFFARRMAENESKPEGLPPSQGGKNVGFGSSSGPAPRSNQQDDVFSVVSQGSEDFIWLLHMRLSQLQVLFKQEPKSLLSRQDTKSIIGMVEDCFCDYETVNKLNTEVLHPLRQDIVKTPFYLYFKVKLWCDCPFWPDDGIGMCRLRDCSVCECTKSEFPEPFKNPLSIDNLVCQEGKPQVAVDRTVDTRAFTGWTVTDNPWISDDETDNANVEHKYGEFAFTRKVTRPSYSKVSFGA